MKKPLNEMTLEDRFNVIVAYKNDLERLLMGYGERIDKLEAALLPFAQIANQYPRLAPNTIIATITEMALTLPSGEYLTFEAFRAAAETLTQETALVIREDTATNAPPEGYIALSDAEIEAAEEEDRLFQTCIQCGELTEDCQCEAEE